MRALVPESRRNRSWIAIIAALLVVASLAGCFGDGGDDDDPGDDPDETESPTETQDPTDTDGETPPPTGLAVLAAVVVDREWGWADNETFTFDASGSTVSGAGEITSYTFDFDDGNETSSEDGVVEHTYERGGLYVVNVTVEAESEDGEQTASDVGTTIAIVAKRYEIGEEELDGGDVAAVLLGGDAENQWNGTYAVSAGATAFAANLSMEDNRGGLHIDPIEGWEKFGGPGPEHPVLANESVVQDDFEDGFYNHTFKGALEEAVPGEYYLNIGLMEGAGAIKFKGTLDIYYDVDPDDL